MPKEDVIQKYYKAMKNLAEVRPGGKLYSVCSYMDIVIRVKRVDEAREKLIKVLGEIQLNEIMKNYKG